MFGQRIENFSECLEVPQERWEAQQDMSKGMAAAKRMPITIMTRGVFPGQKCWHGGEDRYIL